MSNMRENCGLVMADIYAFPKWGDEYPYDKRVSDFSKLMEGKLSVSFTEYKASGKPCKELANFNQKEIATLCAVTEYAKMPQNYLDTLHATCEVFEMDNRKILPPTMLRIYEQQCKVAVCELNFPAYLVQPWAPDGVWCWILLGETEEVKKLILNATTRNEAATMIDMLFRLKHYECIESCLKTIYKTDGYPLHNEVLDISASSACALGRVDILENIKTLDCDYETFWPGRGTDFRYVAVVYGQTNVIEYLDKIEYSKKETDDYYCVCACKNFDCLKWLVEYGYVPGLGTSIAVVENRETKYVELLNEHGYFRHEETLMSCAEREDVNSLKWLISNFDYRPEALVSAAKKAAHCGRLESLEYVWDKLDVETRKLAHLSIVESACDGEQLECFKYMLNKNFNASIIEYALKSNSLNIVAYLCTPDVYISARMIGACCSYEKILNYLYNAMGHDTFVEVSYYAFANKNVHCIRFLRERGIKIPTLAK